MRTRLFPRITQELQKIGPEYNERTPLRLEIESQKEILRLQPDSEEAKKFLNRAETANDLAALYELTFYGIPGADNAQMTIYKIRDALVDKEIASFAQKHNLPSEFVRNSVTHRSGLVSGLYLA